jgi:hypothetical protein
MKLSKETTDILTNFANINTGVVIKKGNRVATVSQNGKVVYAFADITETLPIDVAIYDLNNFLSIISAHKEAPALEFKKEDDKHVYIVGLGGRSNIKYRFCAPNLVVVPPTTSVPKLPEVNFKTKLTTVDFDFITKMAATLQSPNIVFKSDGEKISIVTVDLKNDASHEESLDLGEDEDKTPFNFVFKTENWKMLPGNYDVSFCWNKKGGAAHFHSSEKTLDYVVALEPKDTWYKENK